MAGLVLVVRPLGLHPDVWMVMATGVGLLLLASPEPAFSVGFQLSVAATAGVVVGTGWFQGLKPAWIATALGASSAAQIAVAPILLVATGAAPLWSPVANVLAAPLVMVALGLGGLGALIGSEWTVAAAAVCAYAVLEIAEFAAQLPLIGWPTFMLLLLMFLAAARWRRIRPAAVLVAALVAGSITVAALPHTFALPSIRPAFVALDVGQSDSLLDDLFQGFSGHMRSGSGLGRAGWWFGCAR